MGSQVADLDHHFGVDEHKSDPPRVLWSTTDVVHIVTMSNDVPMPVLAP